MGTKAKTYPSLSAINNSYQLDEQITNDLLLLCRCWGKGYVGQLGDEQYRARGKYPG